MLRRLIDIDENFVEVRELGEDLAMNVNGPGKRCNTAANPTKFQSRFFSRSVQVIKRWMNTACRDLNNFQWRLVANAIAKCSLPIFVKLGMMAAILARKLLLESVHFTLSL